MSAPNPRYRCPLGRLQPRQTDAEAIKCNGWRDEGILVITPEDERLDWAERELVKRIGERLYGRRAGRSSVARARDGGSDRRAGRHD
jgi:hypothetical protein